LVLLSQDEARFRMVPSLCTVLGVKGHRVEVGTWDCQDALLVFGVLNAVSGAIHATTHESRQWGNRKSGTSKTGRMQRAFARHLRHVGRMYPSARYRRVVLITDNAPWHRGRLVDAALRAHGHLELYRLPSYSPCLNVIEHLWKKLRRRSTHNRLFDTLSDLKHAVRNGLRYFQTVREQVRSLIRGCYTPTTNQTQPSGS
jgi:transposase